MTNNVRDNTERHRFELDADGHIAFANYKRADGVLTMLHTEVPKELEGRGIGSALIRGVLDTAAPRGAEGRSRCAPSRKPISKSIRNTPTCASDFRAVMPGAASSIREHRARTTILRPLAGSRRR